MKKELIAVLMCAVMITVLGAGCGSKKEDTKETSDTKKEYTEDELKDSMKGVKLKVGTTGLFGPFTYYDEDGKTLIGYDVDLLNDLQELLGFEIDGASRQWIIRHLLLHLLKINWTSEQQHFVQQMKEKKLWTSVISIVIPVRSLW